MTENQTAWDGVSGERDPSAGASSSALDCLVAVGSRHGMHLTVRQIVQDNALPSENVTQEQLVRCASGCGLKAKSVRLDWRGVAGLQRALPAILNGAPCSKIFGFHGLGFLIQGRGADS